MTWSLSNDCGEFPVAWKALEQFDLILGRSFMVHPIGSEQAR
jgi:hypothetical protein